MSAADTGAEEFDAIVVGAGFGGLYALYRLRQLGLSAVVLEKGAGVGGTWYWNRYPGARCDVESLQYSYSFSDELQQEWEWTERYAGQGEILSYINHVADRFDLRRDVRLNTRVVSARLDERSTEWTVETDGGDRIKARYLIFATGCLSSPLDPELPQLEQFGGNVYRTSLWPEEKIDFTGRRVAVVGTGSSGIQVVPVVAEEARQLFVLQRTPNYSIPGYNGPMSPDFQRDWKARYHEHRAAARKTRNYNLFNQGTRPGVETPYQERESEFENRWRTGGLGFTYAYPDIGLEPEVNDHASDFVRRKIAEKVKDPEVAAKLAPTEYSIGGRRLCVDNGYYESFNRENVTLVDLRYEQLEAMTPKGFRTSKAEYEIDDLILATGFDAFTGSLKRIDIRGRNGLALADRWDEEPANYLGLTVAGFPNMFIVTGPGSPSVLSNMVLSIEQHINWIADCLSYMLERGCTSIEARPESEREWMDHLADIATRSLIFKTKSWYTGSNVAGKKNGTFMYMDGTVNYTRDLEAASTQSEYAGFKLS